MCLAERTVPYLHTGQGLREENQGEEHYACHANAADEGLNESAAADRLTLARMFGKSLVGARHVLEYQITIRETVSDTSYAVLGLRWERDGERVLELVFLGHGKKV
jgi:hypothetical protein